MDTFNKDGSDNFKQPNIAQVKPESKKQLNLISSHRNVAGHHSAKKLDKSIGNNDDKVDEDELDVLPSKNMAFKKQENENKILERLERIKKGIKRKESKYEKLQCDLADIKTQLYGLKQTVEELEVLDLKKEVVVLQRKFATVYGKNLRK